MDAGVIAAIVVAVVVIFIVVRMVRIVPQARAAVVERLGRYVRTQGPGLTLLLPFVDRMRPLIDLREQVVSFPPQPVITSDNLTVAIDSVIYFQVTDPRAASYEIQNYIQAVEQLTITTLRNVVGSLNLEQALTSRDSINTQLRGVLDEATGPWGIRVARVEIKAIDPPPSIQDAMEKQMRADRDKRAIILAAEGQREAAIKSAEGQKAAQILAAEGQKQAAILAAEADRQSRILKAEGERPGSSPRRARRRRSKRPSARSMPPSPIRRCWPISTCRRCRRSRRATRTRCGSSRASSARRWRGFRGSPVAVVRARVCPRG
jgi:regulator of protease activity HflC (stomatin/prohibitin superfamily)